MFFSLKFLKTLSFKTGQYFFIRIRYARVKIWPFSCSSCNCIFIYVPVFLSHFLHWLATLSSTRIADQHSLLYGKSALSEERLVHKILYIFISVPLYFSLVSFVFVFLFLYTRAACRCIMPHHGVSPVHTQGANMAPQDGFNTSFLCVCGFSFAF